MDQVRYSAATPGEMIVFGAQRPGYPSKIVGSDRVKDWISLMQKSGMRRVCCLLPPKQLAYYQVDLIAEYRKVFGESNVCGAEIEDFHLCDHETLERRILPFLLESDQANTPVVVHDALAAVAATGRNPWEAVECGYATEKELHSLLVSDHSKT
jgi:hypothetical protein